jgi:branched-chain amino acid transport system ATP-binding protein
MLFDEPVGGLNPGEMQATMDLIRRVREGGITILLIEHVMAALMVLSDRVMIMNHGEKLYEGSPADVASDADVVRVYLGTERTETALRAGAELSAAAIGAPSDNGQAPDGAASGSAR